MDFYFRIPYKFRDLGNTFFDHYEFENVGVCLDEKRPDLVDPHKRKCRFCGKSFPQVTFNNDAHIIPEFLGNKYFVSDFECDTCNFRLGRLDLQLANYIGIFRTIFGTKGKNGIPTISSQDSLIQAKHEEFFGAENAIKLGSTINDPSSITYNPEKFEHTLEYKKQPYIPFDVYKCLLKMGLCMIDEKEVDEYRSGYEFLRNRKRTKEVKGSLFSIIKHTMPFTYEHTCLWLFKRKDPAILIPPYTLVLVYGCFIYQIYIPFDSQYFAQMKGKEMEAPIFPPYYENEISFPLDNYFFDIEPVCTTEPRHTTERIHFQFNHEELKHRTALDLKTLQTTNAHWDPSKIVSFMLVRDKNFSIKLSK
jgi:hypothetical protein